MNTHLILIRLNAALIQLASLALGLNFITANEINLGEVDASGKGLAFCTGKDPIRTELAEQPCSPSGIRTLLRTIPELLTKNAVAFELSNTFLILRGDGHHSKRYDLVEHHFGHTSEFTCIGRETDHAYLEERSYVLGCSRFHHHLN